MAFSDIQQIQHLLEKSKHILIALKKNPSGDAISGALATSLFFGKQNKHVDVVSENFILPKKFAFLPKADCIKTRMPHLQKFIIDVDVSTMGLQEFSYDIKDGLLKIFITPNHGFFTHENIRTAQTDFRYDLIVTMDTPDLESLGSIYTNNTELFYKVPVLNIDTSPANEHYGTINFVDITASSTSENIANLIKGMNEAALDKEIATALLTGMISATQSFKSKNVKPDALALASQLVGIGADRDFIIKHLYRTKTLSTLKLWGQALAHLEYSPSLGLVTASLTRDDFSRTGASELELYDIIEELILNSPESKLVLLIHEKIQAPQEVQVMVQAANGYNAKQLMADFLPQGDKRQVSFTIHGKTLKEAQQMVTDDLRRKILENE